MVTILLVLGMCVQALAAPSASFNARVKELDVITRAADRATNPAQKAELGLARLQALQKALSAVPVGSKLDPKFLAQYKNEIVFNEPAGQWLVRADRYWALRERYATQPAAERIAWAAASQTLPGECETDGSCLLTAVKRTDGRYLELYPSGAYAKKALSRMSTMLGYLSNDKQKVYEYPKESQAETTATVAYLQRVVTASSPASKAAVLQKLTVIASRVHQ